MKPTSRGIDIVAFSGTRLWSRVIRWRSRSVYSHVGLVCAIDGDEWVIEAFEGKGVRIVPLRVWYQWGGEVTAFRLNRDVFGDVDRQRIIDFAAARVGQEYASLSQFLRSWGVLTRAVCRWLGVRVDLESDRWFCSELVVAAIRSIGISTGGLPSEMTPGDVVKLPYVERTGDA